MRKGPKWHAALGAVDPSERSTALDLLGFEHQVVYSSLCAPLFDIADPDLRYAAYRAHNRAVAGFCAADERLLGVGICDLDDLDRALPELDAALDLGLREIWLPARAPGGRSPGHVDHDPFWARLAERGVPFVLHVGSGALGIGDAWLDNGRPAGRGDDRRRDHRLEGLHGRVPDAPSGSCPCSCSTACSSASRRCTAASSRWAPAGCRRCCAASTTPSTSGSARSPASARSSGHRRSRPSAQLRFTPYPFEDVGWLFAQSDPALYLFSSDYPHAEGGRDPLGRFDRSLAGATDATVAGFYAASASDWLSLA